MIRKAAMPALLHDGQDRVREKEMRPVTAVTTYAEWL